MSIQRFQIQDLSAFQTFELRPSVLELDIEFMGSSLSVLQRLPTNGLAIVGSRFPQERSLDLMESVMESLQYSELVIISGLAPGIDAKAHELALKYGLKTVALLGCGIHTAYPRGNQRLKHKILDQGGLVISQFESDAPPLPHHFILRNRIIAGLARATWVVEAAAISGSLNTAKWTAEYNRDLYATPCFPGDPLLEGNQKLLAHQLSHRYPLATPLYDASALLSTWSDLRTAAPESQQTLKLDRVYPVYESALKRMSTFGECTPQSLLSDSLREGKTPGGFYREYQELIQKGYLTETEQGKVSVHSATHHSGSSS